MASIGFGIDVFVYFMSSQAQFDKLMLKGHASRDAEHLLSINVTLADRVLIMALGGWLEVIV